MLLSQLNKSDFELSQETSEMDTNVPLSVCRFCKTNQSDPFLLKGVQLFPQNFLLLTV